MYSSMEKNIHENGIIGSVQFGLVSMRIDVLLILYIDDIDLFLSVQYKNTIFVY